MFRNIFFLCLSTCFVLGKHEMYEGYSLYEVDVKKIDEVQLINELEHQLHLDVWSHAVPGHPGKILVAEDKKEEFQNALHTAGIEFKVDIQNIQEALQLEDQLLEAAAARSSKRNITRDGLSFDVIHRYDVVDQYLVDLANGYPQTVSVVSAGMSFEGRDIKYLRISNSNFQDRNKPIVIVQSLLHSREWVTLPATLYAIHKLVIDVTDQDLVRDIDWIILPIANPDGYEHSHTTARFWRKNRATGFMVGNVCMGVDLNRNFDFMWSTMGSSNNPCMETFHGRGAFSEPETAIIRDILSEYGNRVELYLDIHSFGSMILYGYGNGQLPANGLMLNWLGVNMAQAIDAVKWPSKRNYIVGNIALVLYQVSGGASDYAQAIGTPFSYTYELPAYRGLQGVLQGFLVDPEFIEQAGFETWEAIKVGARFAAQNFKRQKGMARN